MYWYKWKYCKLCACFSIQSCKFVILLHSRNLFWSRKSLQRLLTSPFQAWDIWHFQVALFDYYFLYISNVVRFQSELKIIVKTKLSKTNAPMFKKNYLHYKNPKFLWLSELISSLNCLSIFCFIFKFLCFTKRKK